MQRAKVWVSSLCGVLTAAACGQDSEPTKDGPDTGPTSTLSSEPSSPTSPSPATGNTSTATPTGSTPAPGTSTAPSVIPPTGATSSGSGPEPTTTQPSAEGGAGGTRPEPQPTPEPSNVGGAGGAGGLASTPSDAGGQAGAGPDVTPPLGGPMVVYVAGYGEDPYPLTVFDFDAGSGALVARAGSVDGGANPTYLALHPERRFLYAANERDDAAGGITAFAIAADGGLTPLNHVTGSDAGFAHLAVDPTGSFVLGASFNGGSVSVFPIEADGSVAEEVSNFDFGSGAQSHCIGFDPSGSHVLVPNRGNHDVGLLELSVDGQLTPNDPASVAVEQGSGPRHIAVRSDGRFAFIMNEDSSTVTPFTLSENGVLSPGQSVSALPADFAGQNSGAHIELSPDGRYVYASNRGHDSIAVFEADLDTGSLTALGHTQTGRTPRDFDVDPTGEWLIVANQNDATLSVFRLGDDGSVTAVGEPVAAPPGPSAVQFLVLDP